jgi:hypothetical protein
VLTNDPVRADVAATALMIDGTNHPRELSHSLEIEDYLIVSETRVIQISRSFAQKIDILTDWPVIITD